MSVPTMQFIDSGQMHFPPPFVPNDHSMPPPPFVGQNSDYAVYPGGGGSTTQDRSSNIDVMEKADERQQKENLQESLRLQRIQAEESSTPTVAPQQPYQYQGPVQLQLKQTFRPGQKPSFQPTGDPDFDGRRLRRTTMRKTVDYNAAIIRELENRTWQRDFRDREHLQPDSLYIPHILPPPSYAENPFNAVTTRFVKTATNKVRCPVFCLAWTPEGRRLITGTSSGEFTLWNGLTFNFETILQAHDCPVRTMVWSNNELWMLTGDHSGYIKYWQSNMNNVKMYQGHREAVRGVSFSPTDNKFVSCSDDGTVRLWDFITCNEERIFRGHGADVKCVHWHPYKSLVASGSKDNQQPVKLWDPRSGKSIATIHAHKATVMDIKWNQNGNWVATASRDHLIKLYDIRNLNTDMQTFRGHKKETSVIAWHPQHEGLMCSGGSDGSILFWHVGTPKEIAAIDQAHDSIVWALAWHPLGHILCSGSNDHSCKFWTRNHPGDSMRDKYNLNTMPASILGFEDYEDEFGAVRIPGMGPEDKVDVSKLPDNIMSSIPGLDTSIFKDKNKPQKKVPYAKPIPRNFQAQWNEQRSSKDIMNSDETAIPDSKMLLNKLFEHAPGAVNVKDLKVDAMYIYGKVVPVKEGAELERIIGDGRDRVIDYVNGGNITELNHVIPHIDPSECIRRYRALGLIKTRGRQILNQIRKPDRAQLKRSRDTCQSSIPSKRWRSDYGDRGGDNYGSYDDDYATDSGAGSYRGDDYGKNYGNYNDSDYRPSSDKGHKNYGGKGGGGRNDYDYDNYDSSSSYRQNSSLSNRGGDDRTNQSDDYYQDGGGGGSRSSRYSDSDRGGRQFSRGRRGSRFSRRPYGGGSRGGGGNESRYNNDRYSENDDDYYDRGGGGSGGQKDDYYDDNDHNDNDDYYDDYADDNNSRSGQDSNSRGGRQFQSGGRGRGGGDRGRRGSYGRGGSSSSWRGSSRGGSDGGQRRSRGRGPRRGGYD